jgi:hypothetical protein
MKFVPLFNLSYPVSYFYIYSQKVLNISIKLLSLKMDNLFRYSRLGLRLALHKSMFKMIGDSRGTWNRCIEPQTMGPTKETTSFSLHVEGGFVLKQRWLSSIHVALNDFARFATFCTRFTNHHHHETKKIHNSIRYYYYYLFFLFFVFGFCVYWMVFLICIILIIFFPI